MFRDDFVWEACFIVRIISRYRSIAFWLTFPVPSGKILAQFNEKRYGVHAPGVTCTVKETFHIP